MDIGRKGGALCVGELIVTHLPPRSTVRKQTTVVISCMHLMGWERERKKERGRGGQTREDRKGEVKGRGVGGWMEEERQKERRELHLKHVRSVVYKQCGETMYGIN